MLLEAQSAIGVLRNALGTCKSSAHRSGSAIGVTKTGHKTCSDMLLEAQSAIGVLRNVLGSTKCDRGVPKCSCLLCVEYESD